MSNSTRLQSWLSIGANFGVLLGLILLIIELRQNSDLLKAEIHQSRSDSFASNRVETADSEFLLPAIVKFEELGGPSNPKSVHELDSVDKARVRMYYASRLQEYDNLYLQYRSGLLDEDFYSIRVVNTVKYLAPLWSELALIRLGQENPRVTRAFAAEVERILAEE